MSYILLPDGTAKAVNLSNRANQFLDIGWVESRVFSNDLEGARKAYAYSVLMNRCISIKANTLSTLPKKFVTAEDIEVSRNHVVRRALGRRTTPLWSRISRDWDIFGMIFLEPVRNPRSGNVYFKRLNPATMEVVRDENGILGFEQRIKGRVVADWYADQLVYVFNYNPNDDLIGLSPTQYIFRNVATELNLTDFIKAYFENGGTPAGILSTDQILRENERKEMAKSWKDNYGGGDNSNKVAVLSGGLTYQPISPVIKDLVVDTVGEFNARKICQIYGVPMTLALETTEDTNRAGSDTARESFYKETLIPEFQFIADEISEQGIPFITNEVIYLEADLMQIEVLQNDRQIITERSTEGFKSGVRSLNESRRLEQLPAIDGGDVFFIGGRLIPQEKLADSEAINVILEGEPLNREFEPNRTEPVNPNPEKQSHRLREGKALAMPYTKTAIVAELRNYRKKVLSKGTSTPFETQVIPQAYMEFIRIDLKKAKTEDDVKDVFNRYIVLFENLVQTPEDFDLIFEYNDYWQGIGHYQDRAENVLRKYFHEGLVEDIVDFIAGNDTYLGIQGVVFDKRRQALIDNLLPIAIEAGLAGMERGFEIQNKDSKSFTDTIKIITDRARQYVGKFVDDIFRVTSKTVIQKLNDWQTLGGNKGSYVQYLVDPISVEPPDTFKPEKLNYLLSVDRSIGNGEDVANSMYNTGMLAMFEQLDHQAEWITMLDEKVCNVCAPMHGVLGSATRGFVSPTTGETLWAPAHPTCRCMYR